MKLLRVGKFNNEKPAIIDDNDNLRDLSMVINDVDANNLTFDAIKKISNLDLFKLPIIDLNIRIGASFNNIGKFICIGLNYSEHIDETNSIHTKHPTVFSKFNSAICGPYDDIHIPKNSKHMDWEIELGVIIGKSGRNIPLADAHEYILGYTIVIDFSERRFQKEMGGQWIKGKSYETFGPIGPWFVTKDELNLADNLDMKLHVNGKLMQDSNSSKMIFKIPFLIHYLSQFFTLNSGDLISTGTPSGVALGMKSPSYLSAGQNVKASIVGLGEQKHLMVQDY